MNEKTAEYMNQIQSTIAKLTKHLQELEEEYKVTVEEHTQCNKVQTELREKLLLKDEQFERLQAEKQTSIETLSGEIKRIWDMLGMYFQGEHDAKKRPQLVATTESGQ